jgi:hypothetical protein
MSSLLENLGILLQKLTWAKILQFSILSVILALGWTYIKMGDQIIDYLKRDKIESRLPPIKKLSDSTIKEINLQASTVPAFIVGTSVVIVNFQKNSKHIVFLSSYNSELESIFSKYNIINIELPAFTQNTAQNSRIVDLINGEFVCDEYTQSGLASEMPDTSKVVQYVCSAGIPPYYGKFVGSVNIYLKRKPTTEEYDQLRVLAKNLSTIVYERELK